jgi:hypothetical protein
LRSTPRYERSCSDNGGQSSSGANPAISPCTNPSTNSSSETGSGSAHRLYRARIGDDWSDLLEEIYTLCRGAWHYLLPDRPEDRARLRAICERTLNFENHFLAVYRDYAVSQLRSAASAHRLHALWVLGQLPLKDEQIIAAMSALDAGKDDELCAAARAALARLAILRSDRAGN